MCLGPPHCGCCPPPFSSSSSLPLFPPPPPAPFCSLLIPRPARSASGWLWCLVSPLVGFSVLSLSPHFFFQPPYRILSSFPLSPGGSGSESAVCARRKPPDSLPPPFFCPSCLVLSLVLVVVAVGFFPVLLLVNFSLSSVLVGRFLARSACVRGSGGVSGASPLPPLLPSSFPPLHLLSFPTLYSLSLSSSLSSPMLILLCLAPAHPFELH